MSPSQTAPAPGALELQRAIALHGQGLVEQAAELYRAILQHEPRHFDALHLLGVAHIQRGDLAEAERLLAAALAIKPDYGPAQSNLGVVLRLQERPADALQAFDRALLYPPVTAETWYNRGLALLDLEQFDEGLAAFERTLALAPQHAGAVQNRGVVFDRIGRYEQAIACFYDAMKLNPGDPSLFHNLGHAFYSLARIDEAAECYRQAIALMADFPEAQMGLAECLFVSGQMEEGWKLYEHRWKTRIVTGGGGGALARFARDLPMPQWRGTAIAGKTVLLHAEQGYGDTLQFCRYAAEVARRGAHVALEVPKPLVRLLSSLDGITEIYERGAVLPQTDFHCPLMSLPLALGMPADRLPGVVPYIRPLPELVEAWAGRLAGTARRPRIGLVWYGQRGPVKELHRSLPPAKLGPLRELDATFVSLQLELRPEDRRVAFVANHIRQFQVRDFADCAGLVANLDLVITVDTAMAHLAGAVGKPVWILLPTVPDWRWGLSGAASDWYPRARLFRQRAQGDWDPVIDEVVNAVRHLFG